MNKSQRMEGFTLIELSIVLVIIGLIVGGVLVGQNLIAAAAVRAQVTQIEKFNQAVNTFFGKFRAWPGDMNPASAAQFGLPTHLAGSCVANYDNGIIEGCDTATGSVWGQGSYETGQFWLDLASQNLIEGNFSGINAGCMPDITTANVATCFPAAKIGNGNYIFAYSFSNTNWYGIGTEEASFDPGDDVEPQFKGLTVAQAYGIDLKMDDGLPSTGNVLGTLGVLGSAPVISNTGTHAPSASSCYDNGSVTNTPQHYSISYPGSAINCSLSIKIQGGD